MRVTLQDSKNRASGKPGAVHVPRLVEWLNKPYKVLLPLKAGTLLERLAKAGEVEASLTLGRTLLRLAERESHPFGTQNDIFGSHREVEPLFDKYEYKTILENNVPTFMIATGLRGLAMLCDHLGQALLVEGAQLGGQPADASYIWRPSIADHEQNHDWDPHDFLVTCIRNSSDQLVSQSVVSLSEVVELLTSRGWHVFDRLAMHVASKWIENDTGPAIELMLRRDLFESYEVSHEYELLLSSAFPRASSSEQAQWLDWIEDGPDLGRYADRVTADTGLPPSPEDLTERADRWRWDKLARVPDQALPEGWVARKRELADRFGAPADLPFAGYTLMGSVSPVTQSQAATLTPEQMAQLADEIPTSVDRFSSPEEGYAGVLQSIAEEQPQKMSGGLLNFIGRKPVFLRSILQGLESAAKSGTESLDWDTIVSIGEWIMAQPREIPGGSGGTYSDLDPGWVWTRSALADVLEEGLRVRTIPPSLRPRVWSILRGLIEDPDAGERSTDDSATDSLNSIRGKAMHGIVLYANWVFETARQEAGETQERALGALMPEVENELDNRLDPNVEPSPGVRAVYGIRIRLLAFLDIDWVRSRAERIFSTDTQNAFDPLGLAAWDSYVKYGGANLGTMRLLRSQYELFVRSLRTDSGPNDVERNVADHVMVMYWHGELGDDPSESDLLRKLFENGSVHVRRRALEFVGRSLRELDDLAEDVRQRVTRLWEFRLASVRSAPKPESGELEAFGWWMESSALDADWRIEQLLEVLHLASAVDADHLVVAALADMDESRLEAALRPLVPLIRADTEGWGVYGWKESAHRLIQRGAASGDPVTVQVAVDAANLLIARGFHEFRSLVPS